MEMTFIVAIAGIIIMSCIAFFIGKKIAGKGDSAEKVSSLESRIDELIKKNASQESVINEQTAKITSLTSERDVQRNNAENAVQQLELQNERNETLRKQDAERYEKTLFETKESFRKQLNDQKESFEKQMATLRNDNDNEKKSIQERNDKTMADMKESYEGQTKALKESYEKQLKQVKENAEKQLEALREMNKKQVEDQLALIKEQMRTTSEDVLKARQEELGARNKEQVSKIIDPLQKSIEDMAKALSNSKEQQKEALTRLDETIKLNMEKSMSLGETADRLTRALTGEVKVQGNFGELKLKQLLEDLDLKEGEQFDTQESIKDKTGKSAKGDDGKSLIPDFILHFPNNRHVVVDSKMALTDYERYMNAEDGTPEKSGFLQAHIDSVRMQVKRLAKKDYTKYLPTGYNRLNFAIMYIPIEGALNLALFNDATLWREAYDQGVMILGPQTMYMNLRVLEMMWTQVKQLNNQQAMMDAANMIIDRVQDFGSRFTDVESSMNDTLKKMSRLKITTAGSGPSIITAAKNLLKAGAQENKRKKGIAEMDDSMFIDSDTEIMLPSSSSVGTMESDEEHDQTKSLNT